MPRLLSPHRPPSPAAAAAAPDEYIHVAAAQHDVRMTASTTAAAMQPPARRKPLRMDAQDGPWSVSVAETAQDSKTYSIYIQSEW